MCDVGRKYVHFLTHATAGPAPQMFGLKKHYENCLDFINLRFLKRFQHPNMRIQPMKFDILRTVEK